MRSQSHLDHVAGGNRAAIQRAISTFDHVEPVFVVMLVAPFVVDPSARKALVVTFRGIGRAVTLIVIDAYQKFIGRELREIVNEPLPRNAAARTGLENEPFVPRYRAKMMPGVREILPERSRTRVGPGIRICPCGAPATRGCVAFRTRWCSCGHGGVCVVRRCACACSAACRMRGVIFGALRR